MASKEAGVDKTLSELIASAEAVADLAERHYAHESRLTRMLQEAAALARNGQAAQARQKKGQADLIGTQVFDYSDALARLISAVKAHRGRE